MHAPMLERRAQAGAIVMLTGAGISKESGLDTFRCANGIWSRLNLEDVAAGGLRPQSRAGARLLQRSPKQAASAITPVVSQNIDDLRERAGSSNRCAAEKYSEWHNALG